MRTEDYAKLFWEVGYVMLEDFFPTALMDQLNNSILSHYGTTPEFQHTEEFLSTAKVEVIPWFPQNEGPSDFDLIDANEKLQSLTEAILGENWNRQYCMVMFSRKGTKGQSWTNVSSAAGDIVDIGIPDANSAYFLSFNSELLRTFDNGVSFDTVDVNSGSSTYTKCSFPTATTGYVLGFRDHVAKSTDNGSTWTQINSGGTNEFMIWIPC